jgi:hypothetical protein
MTTKLAGTGGTGSNKWPTVHEPADSAMALTEHTINDKLADVLRNTRSTWRADGVVSSENTGMLRASTQRPDILVVEPNVSPVVIETEVFPAATVEAEARNRLGKHVRSNGREILSAVAVRLPARLRNAQAAQLQHEIESAANLEMALFAGSDPEDCTRWPVAGWLVGTVADLSILTQSASVPPAIIEAAADQLVAGVSEAAGLLGEMAVNYPAAIQKIGEQLKQEDDEQTRRMATTILANAFIFHESLAGGPGELADVQSLDELEGSDALNKSSILAEWKKILEVNYWPIFDIARRILQVVPVSDSRALIERLKETAAALLANRLMRSHDLTGAIFQKLIADRKFLAAYYTAPASASLLSGLAIRPDQTLAGGSWQNADDLTKLRIADFACGTGTLVSTAYQRIGQLHELAGGDSEAIHPQMMASALIGCDVFPAAAHLTASMLSGAHPTVKYRQSSIMTVAYGKQPDGAVALGSLDLLDEQRVFEILDITASSLEGTGEQAHEIRAALKHGAFDLVIMNPPFTRATGHEGKKIGVPIPMFAAFSSTKEEQREMSNATKRLTKGTSAHGNAGEASIFLVLADRKLRVGGTLALVMPLSLVAGDAWQDSRKLLSDNYGDLVVISIAGADDDELSFSADTGMGECLVVGRKIGTPSTEATFVILNERPALPMLGASVAQQIRNLVASGNLRSVADGPVGGTFLYFGNDAIGQAIKAPLPQSGPWNLSRIADLSLAQTAYQLTANNRLWLPGMQESQAASVPITTVSAIGEIGPYHMDIVGETAKGGVRGPFKLSPIQPHSVPTYPILWSHDTDHQRTMSFEADNDGSPIRGHTRKERSTINQRVATVQSSASHCHFNRDFRFNSQSTSMQFTSRATIGGRAWPSIKLSSTAKQKVLVLWSNTSLGLMLHWWHVNKQQAGRGSSGIKALESLPVLDISALTKAQIQAAVGIFDSFSSATLLSMHEMDIDPVRKNIDERFAHEVLGLKAAITAVDGPLELLRKKLASEPSVRGGK